MSLRSFSKRIAKVAADIRTPAAGAALARATGERIRSAVESRDWRTLVRGSVSDSQHGGRTTMLARRNQAIQIYMPRSSGTAGHDMAEHIVGVVHKRLSSLIENKDFEIAKDPVEALHDFRVASRRLRAFVDVFEPVLDPALQRRTRKPLRQITKAVRGVRDWDVQLKLLHEHNARAATEIERVVIEDLVATATRERKDTAKRCHKQLRKVDFDKVKFAVCATLGMVITWLPPTEPSMQQPLWELLQPLVGANHSFRILDDGLEHAEQMHAFRIKLKRLRYALELLKPAFGDAFEQLYAPIESMQELLGQHHDLFVFSEWLQKRRRNLEHRGRVTLAQMLADFDKQVVTERQALADQFRADAFNIDAWTDTLKLRLGIEQSRD